MFEDGIDNAIILLALWHYWKARNAKNGFANVFTAKLASSRFSQPFFRGWRCWPHLLLVLSSYLQNSRRSVCNRDLQIGVVSVVFQR